MSKKTSKQFKVDWSTEVCTWIANKAFDEGVEAPDAIEGTLAAAIVMARAIGLDDISILDRMAAILENDFPEPQEEPGPVH